MKTLSKSRFVSGVQCEKKLWYSYYRKDLQLPTDKHTQAIFDLGYQIGNLAQNRFPNGKDATPEDFSDFSPSIEKTKLLSPLKMHFVCLIFYIEWMMKSGQ